MQIMTQEEEKHLFYTIGQNIKKFRIIKGWTQQELADACNFDLSFISKLEGANTTQTISIPSVGLIAKELGVHIARLFEDLEKA